MVLPSDAMEKELNFSPCTAGKSFRKINILSRIVSGDAHASSSMTSMQIAKEISGLQVMKVSSDMMEVDSRQYSQRLMVWEATPSGKSSSKRFPKERLRKSQEVRDRLTESDKVRAS